MKSYLVKHYDFETRLASRSGGVFTAISDLILEENGVVYGVVLEQNVFAKHIRVETKEGRNTMRGSKYIQSHAEETYLSVKRDLQDGRKVLFTGTPCQVNALNFFLGKKWDNLVTIDIICHGVPSEKIWQDYVNFVEETTGKTVERVDFRNKYKYGWAAHLETFYFTDGTNADGAFFKDAFFSHEIIRPACFHCKFKNMNRVSDFTIGDAWGIDEANPAYNDDNGVSLLLVNTQKAEDLWEKIESVEQIECEMPRYMQPCLMENYDPPANRDAFWKYYKKHGFAKLQKKYYLDRKIDRWKEKLLGKRK